MHKYLSTALIVGLLSSCSTQAQQKIITVACTADPYAYGALKAGEFIATIVDPATVSTVATIDAVDAKAHPKIIDACASLNPAAVPVSGTVNVVSIPVAPPVSKTTVAIIPVSN